jgi:carboxyl-terminal processing protease
MSIVTKRGMIAAGVAVVIGTGLLAYTYPSDAATATAAAAARCTPVPDDQEPPATPSTPTTITTLEQAYHCILDHTFIGPELDDRVLLTGAFAEFARELERRGIDQPTATLPKLTGHRNQDWAAFARTYKAVLAALPDDADQRQALADATMHGMIDSLHENHTGWIKPPPAGQPAAQVGLGIRISSSGRAPADLRDAVPPMYISAVQPGSPAANAGLRAGDIIDTVNGLPVVVNGALSPGVLDSLHPSSADSTVRLTVQRLGETLAFEVRPAALTPDPQTTSVELVDGDLAHVTLPSFSFGVTEDLLGKIADLRKDTDLKGIVLDLRGNGGGRREEVAKLLGAFTHGKVFSKDCDVRDRCTPNYTDDTTALLNLPLVVLTDGMCASACDDFSAAVKDLKLGKLVGSRTAGVVAGLPTGYTLNDGSALLLVAKHQVGANGEVI